MTDDAPGKVDSAVLPALFDRLPLRAKLPVSGVTLQWLSTTISVGPAMRVTSAR
jgi:hypothetical protein